MNKKLSQQKHARVLRQQGYSINQIYRKLGVAKSSVSIWVRDVPLSNEARCRIEARWTKGQHIAHARRRAQTAERLKEAKISGEQVLENLKMTKELNQIFCALLYWCEGEKTKNDNAFNFTNSDPALISTFLHLFRSGFDIDETKLRAHVHLHDYHDEKAQLRFWSKVTNIPPIRFNKPYRKAHTSKRIREGYAGCVSVRYHDVQVARYMQGIARAFGKKYGPIS